MDNPKLRVVRIDCSIWSVSRIRITLNTSHRVDIPLEKVRVEDIDIAYKMFGKGYPILLFNGTSDGKDAWDPSFLTGISSNHIVIVFDSRGIGNTTIGSKAYTIQLLANDTAVLMDALKIPKADAFGYSMGGIITQQIAVTHPECHIVSGQKSRVLQYDP